MDTPFSLKIGTKALYADDQHSPFDFRYEACHIKESDDFKLEFDAKNPDTKLFLDDLSEYAKLYKDSEKPSHKESNTFIEQDAFDNLYVPGGKLREIIINDQSNSEMQLTPKLYSFRVVDGQGEYYYSVNVILKDMSFDLEWVKMRTNLIHRFSKTLITKNNSFKVLYSVTDSSKENNSKRSQLLESIQDNCQQLISALRQVSESPKFQIKKDYHWCKPGMPAKLDNKSMMVMSKRGFNNKKIYAVEKRIDYNVPSNQHLKFMLNEIDDSVIEQVKYYDYIIHNFSQNIMIDQKEETVKVRDSLKDLHNLIQYVLHFSILKNVTSRKIFNLPKSIFENPVYQSIYKQYLLLNSKYLSSEIRKIESSVWRSTDSIYEMWSYFDLIDLFLKDNQVTLIEGNGDYDSWKRKCLKILEQRRNEPNHYQIDKVFEINTELKYGEKSLNVVYQKDLRNSYSDNYFISNDHGHFNPDIFIEIKKDSENLGAIVLDTKYKALRNCIYYKNDKEFSGDIKKLSTYRFLVKTGDDFKQSTYSQNSPIIAVHALLPSFAFKDKLSTAELNFKTKLNQESIYFDKFSADEQSENDLLNKIKLEIDGAEVISNIFKDNG